MRRDSRSKPCCYAGCDRTRHSTSSYCRFHNTVQFKDYIWAKHQDAEWFYNTKNCEICNVEFEEGLGRNKKCIDHDHDTMEVRGILCNQCNRAVGYFKDNANILLAASKYLHNAH